MAAAKTLIEAHDLSKVFGKHTVVDSLNISVTAGEIFGLVGPDGAGKTTTIRMLCAALRPTAGRVCIAGYDLGKLPEKGRAHIGYMAQRFALYDELTVMENLRFFAEVRGLPAHEWRSRSVEILNFVGLLDYADRWSGRLSGGMKQKLSLAVALVHLPDVLLLDEPTTGVDPVTRQDFWQLIIRLVADGQVAVLVSTPYMDEAARCMRLGFMRSGKLVLEGSPVSIRGRFVDRIIELQGKDLPTLRKLARADRDVEDVQMFGDRLHARVATGSAPQVLARLGRQLRNLRLSGYELRMAAPQLEDVFLSLKQEESEMD